MTGTKPRHGETKMTRTQQIARIRVVLTMVKGRGLRIHTYTVNELKEAVKALLADKYYEIIPDRKLLEGFVGK